MESRTNCPVAWPKISLVVIFLTEVRDQVRAHHPAERIFQFHGLNKQIMLRIEAWSGHRGLEIEAEPLLDALHPCTLGEIQEENQVQNDRRGQDRVAAKEIPLDLHWVTEPAKNVDVVPAFLVVAAWRVVVDAHL